MEITNWGSTRMFFSRTISPRLSVDEHDIHMKTMDQVYAHYME